MNSTVVHYSPQRGVSMCVCVRVSAVCYPTEDLCCLSAAVAEIPMTLVSLCDAPELQVVVVVVVVVFVISAFSFRLIFRNAVVVMRVIRCF